MSQPELPPSAQMMNLLWGKAIATSLSALAKLGVADHLSADEPTSAEAVAAATGAHAPSLYRVLRMLASLGVFHEWPGQRFTLTPLGQCLRADAPDSVRGVAMFLTDEWHMRGYENIEHCVRTGENGVQKVYGRDVFEVMSTDPQWLEHFQLGMSNYSGMEGALLEPLLDFSAFQRLADVAGGHGGLLGQILRKNQKLQGVLFDLPEVIAHAPSAATLGCAGRLTFESGSMFERVPAGCDAYILKHIIHDWDDAHCHQILRLICDQLAAHAPSTGRVFLAEMVVPHTPEPHPAKFLDIEMLVVTAGGKERTEAEYAVLFESAGLELVGVRTTPGPICLIEARVAQR
jgi:hypothetical protein